MPTTITNVVAKSLTGATGTPAGIDGRENYRTRSVIRPNVGDTERALSAVGGAGLIAYG